MTDLEILAEQLAQPDAPLGESLLRLSAILTGRTDAIEVGNAHLDILAADLDDHTISGIVSHLFERDGFRGDVENYHDAANSFLDQVLERRIGMPITLSAVVLEVAQRIGITTHLIGMPGHVVVGLPNDPDVFIDAFGGTELSRDGLQRRFQAIFGAGSAIPHHGLEPIDTSAVVNRVCNNLTRTWASTDTGKLNGLLEVRAALPATKTERRFMIDIAEARGRFDIAAKLRQEIDPGDPKIASLWARLN